MRAKSTLSCITIMFVIFALIISLVLLSGCNNTISKGASNEIKRFKIIEVKDMDIKIGFIDEDGAVIINPQFENAMEYSEGLCPVQVGGKWGFIDYSGAFIINPQYDKAYEFSDGLALIEKDDKYGYVDKTGKVIINPQFENANSFSEGLAKVTIGVKDGYIDNKGTIVINPIYDNAGDFSEGLAWVSQGSRIGFIDSKGKYMINPQFYYAGDFSGGMAPVQTDDTSDYGFIDKSGSFIINPQFAKVDSFSDGLARIQVGDKWGYIDKDGKIVVNPQFDDACSFSEGLARVQSGTKWGFIDKTGRFIIDPQFDDGGDFINGLAFVYIDNPANQSMTYAYNDKLGKIIWSANVTYTDIEALSLIEDDEVEFEEDPSNDTEYNWTMNDFQWYGVGIGMTQNDVLEIVGKPLNEIDGSDYGEIRWEYSGAAIIFGFLNNYEKVDSILLTQTPDGKIRISDSYTKLVDTYGTPSLKEALPNSANPNTTFMVEYESANLGTLVFSIYENQVEEIGIGTIFW